jgi:GGDEF domain-containing protein
VRFAGSVFGAAARRRCAAFSAGVAVCDRAENLDDLVKRCDLAQYEAKRCGGAADDVMMPGACWRPCSW